MTNINPPLTVPRLLGRGITRRCPVCGQGHLFRRWVTMAERCPQCDFRFEREEGGWIGAIGTNTIVTVIALFVVVVLGFVVTYPDPPVGVLLAIVVGVAVVTPLAFYPCSKTLWLAIDLAMRPLRPGEVDPRYEPPERVNPRGGRTQW